MELKMHRLLPFIPPHLARKVIANPFWEEQPDSDRVTGALLFADISGFTPLTEELATRSKEGPEELTRLLNRFFTVLIDHLATESGEVVKFSGDALLVLFPADHDDLDKAARRASQAAEGLQQMVSELGTMQSSVGDVRLAIKIGIGVGEVVAMEVGGLLGRWEYVVAGDPIRQAAACEAQACPGDIVLSEQTRAIMYGHPLEPRKIKTVAFPRLDNFEQVEKTLRRFVPGAVLGWLETQDRGWLCVLRPMTVLFIGTTTLDYDDDSDLTTLNELVRNVQRTLYRFEGSLNKVAVDDKGTVIMALFGAPPLAHSDDAIRGIKAALEIQALSQRMSLPLAVGVTTGYVFAGPVGSERRYEYTVMGDTVNLAARLMKAAGPGNVLCDRPTYVAARERLRIDPLDPIEVKGKSERVEVFHPNDEQFTSRLISGTFRPPRLMVGRDDAVATIKRCLGELREGRGGAVLIHGGAGMGKTRLLKELEIQARIQGLPVLRGAGRSTERQVSLRAWQSIFEGFYGIENESEPARRYESVRKLVSDLTPSLVDQISLLREPLNLGLPQGTQEIILDPDVFQQSLLKLTDSVLAAWLATRPLVILMDDAQWLDTRSWSLLLHTAQQHCTRHRPLLIGLATRPMERGSEGVRHWNGLTTIERHELIEPEPLTEPQIEAMIADRLQVAVPHLPPRLLEFMRLRSEGNPFIIEELLRAMSDQGLIEVWRDRASNQQRCRISGQLSRESESLPGSVRGLLLARMDRLSAEQQLTLKVASVFGRNFPHDGLVQVLQQTEGFEAEQVRGHLETFIDIELIEIESTDTDVVYRFGHQVTQEVAYDSMLFSQRRKLHLAAAAWLLECYGDGFDPDSLETAAVEADSSRLAPFYQDLARHYLAAGERHRELVFTVLSGQKTSALFRNEEAERLFARALELVSKDDQRGRFAILRAREVVYTRMGSRSRRKADLMAMQDIAREIGDPHLKAEVAILQAVYQFTHGRLKSSRDLAQSAIELSQEARSHRLECRARHTLGIALVRSGDHREGRVELESALKLAENAADRAMEGEVNISLARYAERAGEFVQCLARCERALEITRDLGHLGNEARILRRMASAKLALGDLPAATELADQAEEIQRQIGDARQECVTLDLLGRIAIAGGDHARAKSFFERSLGIRQAIADRTGQLRSLTLLGEACFHLGAYEKTRICYQQALEDAQDMGMAYDQAEINARMVLLEHSVGENERARQHGLDAAKALSRLNSPSVLAHVLTNLGHAFAELGEYDSAAAAYGNAMQIRGKLGQKALLMETVAGSAMLDFKRGRHTEALEKVEEILKHIEERGLEGTIQPFRIYQTCFEVLEHADDERGTALIARAHQELTAAAEAISDEILRDSFQGSVIENRAIAYYHHGIRRRAGTKERDR